MFSRPGAWVSCQLAGRGVLDEGKLLKHHWQPTLKCYQIKPTNANKYIYYLIIFPTKTSHYFSLRISYLIY
jgi:hypothetical protein